MITNTSVAAFTSVCEEDAHWLDKYFAEIERLGIGFTMHLDRCSLETKKRVRGHPHCLGTSAQVDPSREFEEWDKQEAFDLTRQTANWALAWDVDETWETKAAEKLKTIDEQVGLMIDAVLCPWWNLWDTPEFIRIDRSFSSRGRVKLYNLRDRSWKFDHKITNGAKLLDRPLIYANIDMACLHWGMMTQEQRLFHKERWDRIYGRAVGANPYGFWNMACDTSIEPVLVKHGYLS